ncbi:MAG TPA: hypothetical protein VGG60_09375 [Candidatus Binataceae bacterium]
MSERPRIRREDPDRAAPVRHWGNLFRSAASPSAPSTNGSAKREPTDEMTVYDAANGPASASNAAVFGPISEDARIAIENAYRVVDEHLQEGRRAAQSRRDDVRVSAPGAFPAASIGSAGIGLAAENIQAMVAESIRFYSTLAPLWTSVVNSIATAATAASPPDDAGLAAAPLARPPMPGSETTMVGEPIIIELASARMTRVTIDLIPQANATKLATSGLHSIVPNCQSIRDLTFIVDSHSNRPVVRIRVPDDQPVGCYNGVIVDIDSGDPRGTITLRVEA